MKILKKNINKIIKLPILILIKVYKMYISPILPNTCGFIPTCSDYMEQSILEFGIIKGLILGIKRISKCRPGGKCGFDPIPSNIKGDIKWLL